SRSGHTWHNWHCSLLAQFDYQAERESATWRLHLRVILSTSLGSCGYRYRPAPLRAGIHGQGDHSARRTSLDGVPRSSVAEIVASLLRAARTPRLDSGDEMATERGLRITWLVSDQEWQRARELHPDTPGIDRNLYVAKVLLDTLYGYFDI